MTINEEYKGLVTRDVSFYTAFQKERSQAVPLLASIFESHASKFEAVDEFAAVEVPQQVRGHFSAISDLPLQCLIPGPTDASNVEGLGAKESLRVGVYLGGILTPASGTHNVILGLRKFVQRWGNPGELFGLHDLKANRDTVQYVSLTSDDGPDKYLNQGGADLLPAKAMPTMNEKNLQKIMKACEILKLQGLVIIGGFYELSQAAVLAQHFAAQKSSTAIVGVFQSPNGRVRLPKWLPLTLGFDSAAGVLAEITGSILLDTPRLTCNTYHFIRCGSGQLTVEISMQVRPTLCFLSEELTASNVTLKEVIAEICDVIVQRHQEHGQRCGTIMLSDAFFESLKEMAELKSVLHSLRQNSPGLCRTIEETFSQLPEALQEFASMLPEYAQHSLVFRTDPNTGLPLLPQIEAERELGKLVQEELERRSSLGETSIEKLVSRVHNLTRLARCPPPTPFDCVLGWSLGHIAGRLVAQRLGGYVASTTNLEKEVDQWGGCGIPFVRLLAASQAEGNGVPGIRMRTLTEEDTLYRVWRRVHRRWRSRMHYRQSGPVQHVKDKKWGGLQKVNTHLYTLLAEYKGEDELVQLVEEGMDEKVDEFIVRMPNGEAPLHFTRRSIKLLSPLQRRRLEYNPTMPELVEGGEWCFSDQDVPFVCRDMSLVHEVFPELSHTGQLKAVAITEIKAGPSVELVSEAPDVYGTGHDYAGGKSPKSSKAHKIKSQDFFTQVAKRPTPTSVKDNSGLRIGVATLSRPVPGVYNILQGLLDFLQRPERSHGTLIGFAAGMLGLLHEQFFEITAEMLAPLRNQASSDLLGRGDDDMALVAQNLDKCAATCQRLKLDGLVIWGGRDAHHETARMAEYFVAHHIPTRVIAIPVSLQSDIPLVEQSLGYDTACKVYSSVVGILATDAASSQKVWYFLRIATQSVTSLVEVAMQTHPHMMILAEEIKAKKMGLPEVVNLICDTIEMRAEENKHYGIVIIPQMLLANVPEIRHLLDEIDELRALMPQALGNDELLCQMLSPVSRALFQGFPMAIRGQIRRLTEAKRVDLASVETEQILKDLVEKELMRRKVLGTFKGSFQCVTHTLAYHAQDSMPSNFDCNLGYTMGFAAGVFLEAERTGILVNVEGLDENPSDWRVSCIPLPSLLNIALDRCSGKVSLSIDAGSRLLYDHQTLSGMPPPTERLLRSPGPLQFSGASADSVALTLTVPVDGERVKQLADIKRMIQELKDASCRGIRPSVLAAVNVCLHSGIELLKGTAS